MTTPATAQDGAASKPASDANKAELEAFYLTCLATYQAGAAETSKDGKQTAVDVDPIALILSQVPAEQRQAYLEAQRRARAEFHAQAEQDRRQTLAILLSGCPSHSALFPNRAHPPSDADLMAKTARHRRRKRFADFVDRHCKKDRIGLHPFFAALYALFQAQSSGANTTIRKYALAWELDDAVLLEGGDDAFRSDAVVTLKGVLGFSEALLEPSKTATQQSCATRTWTVPPVLTDKELVKLLPFFPAFVRPTDKVKIGVGTARARLRTGTATLTGITRAEAPQESDLRRLLGDLRLDRGEGEPSYGPRVPSPKQGQSGSAAEQQLRSMLSG
ncbi:hypothetical protein OC834_001373 [Tilletia horrida]|nr:hypothetical protein OC834_001373 [Tilletia horrida]